MPYREPGSSRYSSETILGEYVERIERLITKILESIVTVFFGVIILVTILLVIMRYIFNSSVIGGNELMEYLFIYTTALGAAVAIGKRDHISIDFFLNKLPEPAKTYVDIFGLILVAGLNILIVVLSNHWISKVGFSESPVLRIPMWSVEISVPIGCILAALFCFFVIVKEIRSLAGRRSVK